MLLGNFHLQLRDVRAIATKFYHVLLPHKSKTLLHDCKIISLDREEKWKRAEGGGKRRRKWREEVEDVTLVMAKPTITTRETKQWNTAAERLETRA